MAEEVAGAEWIVFPDKEALSLDAAYRFAALAAQRTGKGAPFSAALSGGSTPAMLFELLAAEPFKSAIDWRYIHLFFGDERCVPPDNADSNYRQANELLFTRVPLPDKNIHRIQGELPDHDEGARQYEAELRRFFSLKGDEPPRFDLVMLGMGPDGHCASLFPHKPALQEKTRLAAVSEPGLKPFVPRITLTYPAINSAAEILFLVAGSDKAETLARVLPGPADPDTLPSQAVTPTNGKLTWLVDRDAATLL